MKSGITRRIDELGRIVVPKEIRSNLGIRDGELLEIFVEENTIIIKKYLQALNIIDISENLCKIMSDICNIDILITDREKVIVTSNNLKEEKNLILDDFFRKIIDNRDTYISEKVESRLNLNKYFIVMPIITSSLCSGLVIIPSNKPNKEYLIYAKIIQKILTQKLDVA